MKKNEFVKAVEDLVQQYINNRDAYGEYAQLTVNPELLTIAIDTSDQFQEDLADADEAIEEAAAAEGDESENATDYQARQDPDYYQLTSLVKRGNDGVVPDMKAIDRVADNYFE